MKRKGRKRNHKYEIDTETTRKLNIGDKLVPAREFEKPSTYFSSTPRDEETIDSLQVYKRVAAIGKSANKRELGPLQNTRQGDRALSLNINLNK